MSNKLILISFLGTTNYLECYYKFNEQEKFLAKYTQIAIASRYHNQLDKIVIFLTKDAKSKNWEIEGGLKEQLERLIDAEKIKSYDIPDGVSEDELKEILKIIDNAIDNEAIIIIDATHSFRSLPLNLSAIINYLKITKNIKVEAIYYGAFEKLGNPRDNEKLQPAERLVPMLDLTFLSSLQDWTLAINNFLKFGNVTLLSKLSKDSIYPILKESKGQNEFANILRDVIEQLEKLVSYIYTCRIKDLLKFDYQNLKINVNKLTTDELLIFQLKKPFVRLKEQLDSLSDDPFLNVILLVKWCIDYKWIQQGYTLLQEGFITYVLQKNNIDYLNTNIRSAISEKLIHNNIITEITEEEINKITSIDIDQFSNVYKSFANLRNDINHGGTRENAASFESLKSNLLKNCDDIISLLNYERKTCAY